MKTYTPNPIDTSLVELPQELNKLTESLAKNVHETWAAERIAEGWQWGEARDDLRNLHPCLIPYEDLPESERDYDRKTAMETLKTILKLGFSITK